MEQSKPTCPIPELGPGVYARWRASEVGAITERLERRLVIELLGDVRSQSILDVGCGDGDLAVELWRRGAHVVGIDASNEMIAAAQQRAMAGGAGIAFQVAAAQRLPFRSAQFDTVVAVTILCFVAQPGPVFSELARVLRPGGRLVIGELGLWSSWALARRIRGWLGSRLWRNDRFWTARELRTLAERTGLQVETIRGAVYYPRWNAAARLLARFDAACGRVTTIGAGFIALSAVKSADRRVHD